MIGSLVIGVAGLACAEDDSEAPPVDVPEAGEVNGTQPSESAPPADETPDDDAPPADVPEEGEPPSEDEALSDEAAPPEDEASSEADASPDAEQVQHEREERESTDTRAGTFSPDDINVVLRESWEPVAGLFRIDPIIEPWVRFSDYLRWNARLDLGIAYTTLFQTATKGQGPKSAAGGDFDFFATWHLTGLDGDNAGRLGFSAEFRHDFGGIAPASLNQSFGSLLRTTNGFNTRDFSLKQLWWQQELFEGHAFFRVGVIAQDDFFATGRFQSANFFFLNEAFSSSLAVPFPGTGPGIAAFIYPHDKLYIGGGVGLADPDDDAGFSQLFDNGELFVAVEAAIVDPFEQIGPGNYRLTFSHSDGVQSQNKPPGDSISISCDQQVGRFVPFVKYSIANRSGLTQIRQIATAGVGVSDPLGNEGDFCGLAFAWAQPDDQSLTDEYVIEAFYRLQLTPSMQITPDVQLIIDPAFNQQDDVVAVFGLRLRIQY